MTVPNSPSAEQSAEKARSKGALIVGGIIVLAVAASGIAYLAFKNTGEVAGRPAAVRSPVVPSPEDRSTSAKTACEGILEEKLKAWSSAKFSGESALKKSDLEYRVVGRVDAETLFGKSVRSAFTCDVTTDGRYNWTAKRVSLSDRG